MARSDGFALRECLDKTLKIILEDKTLATLPLDELERIVERLKSK